MKGSNKEFSRFLESEYNDIYLQPLETHDTTQDILKEQQNVPNGPQKEFEALKDFQPLHDGKIIGKKPLSKGPMKEFVAQLGEDAQNCIEHMKLFKIIKSKEVFEAYRDLYSKFRTVLAIFFSIMPDNQTIYLWQINRLCPYKKNGDLVLDSNGKRGDTCPHMSFMLVAKITAGEGEQIAEAKLLGDRVLCVKTKHGENQLIMKLYYIENFVDRVIVNPFRQQILANNHYTIKLVIKGYRSDKYESNNLDISFWKKDDDRKETLLQTRTCIELANPFTGDLADFNDTFRWGNGMILVADRTTGIIIALKESSLAISTLRNCYGKVVEKRTNLNLDEAQECLRVKFDSNALVKIDTNQSPQPIIPENWKNMMNEWQRQDPLIERSIRQGIYAEPGWEYSLYIYDVPNSLLNPNFVKSVPKEEDTAEKVERLKNDFKFSNKEHATIKEKNEMLNEIRADIALKMKEVKKFDEEYKKEDRIWAPKKLEEPKGVARETLELYNQIKSEKKKIEKNREKEKGQRKKDRLRNDEF